MHPADHVMTRPIVIGNWKMHGDGAWLDRIDAIAAAARANPAVEVALCVPATLLHRAADRQPALTIGAQDCHAAPRGAHTGGLSATMLHEAGARLVILGHSERRRDGDDDGTVAAKIAAAAAAGLRPLLCVGEEAADRADGRAAAAVADQLRASLPDDLPDDLIVAYEPVWAIGRGQAPTAAEIAPVIARLHDVLADHGLTDTPILYGGSVDEQVAMELLDSGLIDGLLVGGASLDAAVFTAIIAVSAWPKLRVTADIGMTNMDIS